jgi:DNA-binding GntR family transcriptional regulator
MGRNENGPIAKATKSESAVARLRQAIWRGEIAPGEWLRQEDLAERFGISPTPVREALRQLEADGLVEHIPHRGVKVVAYTLNTAREYYDLRVQLEPYALRLAAARMNTAELEELRALVVEAQGHLERQSLEALTDANWRFHEKLMWLCGSRLVQDVLARVRRSFQLDTLLLIPERAAASVEEHRRLVEALERGDVDGAAHELRTNIQNARDAMLARLPSLGITVSPRPTDHD